MAVKKGTHLVCVCANGDAKGAGKTKVGQLDVALAIDEQVLWLEVTVQHTARVAKLNALEQLEHVGLDNVWLEAANALHVLLQVPVKELKGKVKVAVRVNHLEQAESHNTSVCLCV